MDDKDQKEIKQDENLNDIIESEKLNKTEEEDDEKIDCISKVIGNFGPWQKKFVIFYMITYLISPFQNYGIVFYSAKAKFWCADIAQNLTEDGLELIKNQCVPNCTKYEHDRSLYHTTIINEWDLVCDKQWLVSTAASVYQLGYAFSSLIVGYCSDRFGRRPTFKTILFIEILAGFGQALAPSIYFFLASRFMLGLAAYGRFLTGVLLIMETVGPKKRAMLSIMVENSWYIGTFFMIGFFYYIPNFRYVQFTVTAIQVISLFYLHIVPESIRWLLTKGKYEEAKNTLRNAAQIKHKTIDPSILEKRIDKLINHFEEEEKKEKNKQKQTILDLWKIPRMLAICVVLYLCWFTNHFIAYATIFNATDFGSNLYLNMTIFTTASFGANTMLYLIIERFNRKTMARVSYTFMFLACFCLMLSFYVEDQEKAAAAKKIIDMSKTVNDNPMTYSNNSILNTLNKNSKQFDDIFNNFGIDLRNVTLAAIKATKTEEKSHLRLWLGMILKYSTSTCYHVIYVLSVETFPTIMRQLGVGTCSVASRVSSVTAPFTKELSNLMGLPFTFSIFTTLALCSFIAINFVPETRGKEIPNTIADCLKKDKKIIKNKSNQENTRV